jgi:hypothetical protein
MPTSASPKASIIETMISIPLLFVGPPALAFLTASFDTEAVGALDGTAASSALTNGARFTVGGALGCALVADGVLAGGGFAVGIETSFD